MSDAPATLASYQRQFLKARAHELKPLVHVGESGVTDGVVAAVAQALLDHELIKVRLHEPANKKAMAQELAERAEAHLCGVVGHTVILYRAHPEKPRIVVPVRQRGEE